MNKLKTSKRIVKESWEVLKKDKEMLWFPAISAVICSVISILFYFLWTRTNQGNESTLSVVLTAVVSYLAIFFVANMANAGVLTIASGRFKGQDLNFTDGVNGIKNNIGKILLWSVIDSTVNFILNYISEHFKFLGKIVAFFLGAAWDILTYFSFLSLVVGGNSLRESFRESAALIKKTWGEAIIINVGVSMYLIAHVVVGFVLGTLIFIVFPFDILLFILLPLGLIYFVILCLVFSTLGVIFKLALYEYARTGVVPQGFSADLIQSAITPKT